MSSFTQLVNSSSLFHFSSRVVSSSSSSQRTSPLSCFLQPPSSFRHLCVSSRCYSSSSVSFLLLSFFFFSSSSLAFYVPDRTVRRPRAPPTARSPPPPYAPLDTRRVPFGSSYDVEEAEDVAASLPASPSVRRPFLQDERPRLSPTPPYPPPRPGDIMKKHDASPSEASLRPHPSPPRVSFASYSPRYSPPATSASLPPSSTIHTPGSVRSSSRRGTEETRREAEELLRDLQNFKSFYDAAPGPWERGVPAQPSTLPYKVPFPRPSSPSLRAPRAKPSESSLRRPRVPEQHPGSTPLQVPPDERKRREDDREVHGNLLFVPLSTPSSSSSMEGYRGPLPPRKRRAEEVQEEEERERDRARRPVYLGTTTTTADILKRLREPSPSYSLSHMRDGEAAISPPSSPPVSPIEEAPPAPWWQVEGTGYDYSRDFYATADSLKKVKEKKARKVIELIQAAVAGNPPYQEYQVKVVILRKRSKDGHWDVGADYVVIPQGHNPSLGHLLFSLMLRLSPYVKKECVRRFKAFSPQVEISRRSPSKDQEESDRNEAGDGEDPRPQTPAASSSSSPGKTFQVVANEDLTTPMREIDEVRVYLENTPAFDEELKCFENLDGELLTILPRRVYGHLKEQSLPTLVLIPTPGSKPLPRYSQASGSKEADPLVIYNFLHPFHTSIPTEVKLSKDADLALGQLSSLIVKAGGHETESTCNVHWTKYTPAYTALVIDPEGALYHVPLSKREITIRQLMAISDIANSEGTPSENPVRVALTVFFPALLTSEALAIHDCRPDVWRQLIPGQIPLGGYSLPVFVTTQCSGVIKKKCRRRSINLLFSDHQVTVRDALLALRSYMRRETVERSGRPSPRECFVGYAQLKSKERRTLGLGHPWKALQASTALTTLLGDPSTGFLLAPKTTFFKTEASTAHMICPSYSTVLAQENIFVYPVTQPSPSADLSNLRPAFGTSTTQLLTSTYVES
ncbi:hypothetical protein CSUI_002800 [Cystoisospora suis]|uniref:Uncharacterized protein n=1 Tax=Cystoisospora suis TaxID=483139 RepID=A0A2C6L6N9_9APIC|nr:hypothetical protein CSUI_002800 [Cystoisospora suis]